MSLFNHDGKKILLTSRGLKLVMIDKRKRKPFRVQDDDGTLYNCRTVKILGDSRFVLDGRTVRIETRAQISMEGGRGEERG